MIKTKDTNTVVHTAQITVPVPMTSVLVEAQKDTADVFFLDPQPRYTTGPAAYDVTGTVPSPACVNVLYNLFPPSEFLQTSKVV